MLSAAVAIGMGSLDPEILFPEIYPKEIIWDAETTYTDMAHTVSVAVG